MTTPDTPRTGRQPEPERQPERVDWSVLGPEFLRSWGQPRGEIMPEHLAIYGQTGSGKSYFEKVVLLDRARLRGSHVVLIATKPADATLASMGWPIIDRWPPERYRDQHQVIFWAKAAGISKAAQAEQRAKIVRLLDQLWVPGSNRIIVFDELAYFASDLGLRVELTTYYREARALGITIVASTQRPAGVPRWMHSESAWSVFFAPKDEEDAERMAQVAGSKRLYMPIMQSLNREKYEFLMVRNLTGEMYISHITRKRMKRVRKADGTTITARATN